MPEKIVQFSAKALEDNICATVLSFRGEIFCIKVKTVGIMPVRLYSMICPTPDPSPFKKQNGEGD